MLQVIPSSKSSSPHNKAVLYFGCVLLPKNYTIQEVALQYRKYQNGI